MLIRLLHWGWCICFFKIKEANSEILRIILALFTMAPIGVSNVTVTKTADGSFKYEEEAKISPPSYRPVSSISKGWGW